MLATPAPDDAVAGLLPDELRRSKCLAHTSQSPDLSHFIHLKRSLVFPLSDSDGRIAEPINPAWMYKATLAYNPAPNPDACVPAVGNEKMRLHEPGEPAPRFVARTRPTLADAQHGRSAVQQTRKVKKTLQDRQLFAPGSWVAAIFCLLQLTFSFSLRRRGGDGARPLGRKSEKPWDGSIAVSRGTISQPRPLGLEADEPGSMWLEEGRLLVRQRSPRTYNGVDLVVTGPADARLIVQLTGAAR